MDKQELIELAEGLDGTQGHGLPTMSQQESKFFWDYVYNNLGLDCCDGCGDYIDATFLDSDSLCDCCQDDY